MNNRITQTENRIAQLNESKNKSLRSLAALTAEGKDQTPAALALLKAIEADEETISMLRTIINNPSFRAMREQEERDAEQRVQQQLTSSVVTAVKEAIPAPAVIIPKTEDRAALVAGYRAFLKTGKFEARDILQTGSGISLVPAGFSTVYQQALKQVSPLAATVQAVESSRITKVFSVADVTSDQKLLTESSTVGASADPVFSSFQPSYTDSGVSICKVSWQTLAGFRFLDGKFRPDAHKRPCGEVL